MLSEKEGAIKALERMWNYCEEIDNHLPEAEQTGYKMLPDYLVVWTYLKSLPDWIPCSSGVMQGDNDNVIVSIHSNNTCSNSSCDLYHAYPLAKQCLRCMHNELH